MRHAWNLKFDRDLTSNLMLVFGQQGDAMGLKAEVDRILRRLDISAAAAERSVFLLRQIDTAKSRMEEACSLLKVPSAQLKQIHSHLFSLFSCCLPCMSKK